jgi:hypothetical protein
MDILSDSELNDCIKSSKLSAKYNKSIDRESAFEMLTEKIERAQERAEYEAKIIEKEEELKKSSRSSSSSRRSGAANPVIKVLTSATFIRGALGILSKLMK